MKGLLLALMLEVVMKWLGGMRRSIPAQLFLAAIQIVPQGVCLCLLLFISRYKTLHARETNGARR
jgi:hypothetical protein